MSSERLERLENMVADLIRIVGKNNTLSTELFAEISAIKADLSRLGTDVDKIRAGVAQACSDMSALNAEGNTAMSGFKKDMEQFRGELDTLARRLEASHRALLSKGNEAQLNAKYAVDMALRHDKEIFTLKEMAGE